MTASTVPLHSITATLQINSQVYDQILTRLCLELQVRNIYGAKLNNQRNKTLARKAFAVIYMEFQDVFEKIPEASRDKWLTLIAQRCNYNRRRRRTPAVKVKDHDNQTLPSTITKNQRQDTGYWGNAKSLSSTTAISTTVDGERNSGLEQEAETGPPSYTIRNGEPRPTVQASHCIIPVGRTMVQTNRSTSSVSCRPQDLLHVVKAKEAIQVDDLDFELFTDLLRTGLQYNPLQDILVFERQGIKDMIISNTNEWKAALEEMHFAGYIRFLFSIKPVEGKLFNPDSYLICPFLKPLAMAEL